VVLIITLFSFITTSVFASLPCSYYSSASLVDNMDGDLSSVVPMPKNCGGLFSCSFYTSSSSCLGANGPIGGYGPLGSLGPIGTNLWNPSYWISGAFDWSNYSQDITGMGGPLSENGPLGKNGCLGLWYNKLPSINDFALHLKTFGIWSVLGPASALGALGALGPLGPIGAHGLISNFNGDYIDSNNYIVRNVTIKYDSRTSRMYPLYEQYTRERAIALGDTQDTSFMTTGDNDGDKWDVYTFTAAKSEVITILVVPIYTLDFFNVVLSVKGGKVIAKSDSHNYINWIHFANTVPGQRYTISVQLGATSQFFAHTYRLFVTGDCGYLPSSSFKGKYIKSCN